MKIAYLPLSKFYLDQSQFYSSYFAVILGIHACKTIGTVVNMSGKINAQMCSIMPCASEITTMRDNELTLVFCNAKLIYSKRYCPSSQFNIIAPNL
jgi:hypothetical protein